jgi:two-component system chemotaxis response regulator CheY
MPRLNISGCARRAIVVDDSSVMRALLRRGLERRHFEVTEAENGQDALLRLAQMPVPDLALIDLNMPYMNGIDLVRTLRANRAYKRLVVVMVASETGEAEIERALAAGVDEYLMKPLTIEILFEKLTLLEWSEEHR